MTNDEFEELQPGDIVKHHCDPGHYVVVKHHGNRVEAQKIVNIYNPNQWDVKLKSRKHNNNDIIIDIQEDFKK